MKTLNGTVVSTKMQKSAVVKVDRLWQHPLYKKRIKKSKKYLVHNSQDAQTGDRVQIQETKPISRRKRWKITKIIKKAQ